MKKLFVFLIFSFAVTIAFGQEEDTSSQQSVYLLPDFVAGKVLFKNAAVQEVNLNYNTFFQQMIFQQNDQMMAIGNIEAVDTIFMAGAKYVPFDTLFYEIKMEEQRVPYYILHTCKLNKTEQTGSAYSGISATGSQREVDLSTYRFSVATPYRLKLPITYTVERQRSFYVKQGNKILPLKNAKQFKNLFPGKEEEMKYFIKDNNISFVKEVDIQKLLLFCNHLK